MYISPELAEKDGTNRIAVPMSYGCCGQGANAANFFLFAKHFASYFRESTSKSMPSAAESSGLLLSPGIELSPRSLLGVSENILSDGDNGAASSAFAGVPADIASLMCVRLEQNFRSTRTIVAASNAIIQYVACYIS